jgi:hypothetical protein
MAKLNLRNHPKFKLVQRDLDLPTPHLVGHLEMLWHTAYERVSNRLPSFTSDELEISADWNGTPGAFTKSLLKRGFIEEMDNSYMIHNLTNHWPEYVRKRYQRANERQTSADNGRHRQTMADSVCPPSQAKTSQAKP